MTGRLLYVIGPSGAGKDTVLLGVQDQLGGKVHIAPRVITRPCDPSENHAIGVSHAQFLALEDQGHFALAWRANNLAYGISQDIKLWLSSGLDVLVNGSRAYLPHARLLFPDLLPVLLQVQADELRMRLQRRGREDSEQIDARMQRNARLQTLPYPHQGNPVVIIDNSGPVEHAITALCQLLEPPPWAAQSAELQQARA
ncbi:MAG: phosphonate metabolism protein/1,5-bisphosphokinase (PRPP-forming) PhnN [Burkholderiaceae bacterium]|nr:phosphonate metabolism protein/1,5-bisphosphokinase (PRPP-forming) PhnN [Burkholderiaceae bacterium]